MAITDYLADSLAFAGSWPGANADPAYALQLLKMAYKDEMLQQMQQKDSRLASRGMFEEITGYEKRISRFNSVTLSQRARGAFIGDDVSGGAAADETGIRTVVLRGEPWEFKEFFDPRDEVGMMNMLRALTEGVYKQNVKSAFNRKRDSNFAVNLIASVQLGDGGGSSAFSGTVVNGVIQDDGTVGAVVSKMNAMKAIELRHSLEVNNATDGSLAVAIHPIQVKQMLQDPTNKVISADFNALRPLMNGQIVNYLGMDFIPTTEMPAVTDIDTGSTGNQPGHNVIAFNGNAMRSGFGKETVWTEESVDRGKAILHFHSAFLGSVRTDDLGVVYVPCADNSASPA